MNKNHKNSGRGRIFHVIAVVTAIIATAILYAAISSAILEPEAHISPNYPKIDLRPVLLKDRLTDRDYQALFFQSGLGRPAVDELRARCADSVQRIIHFQENFFRDIRYVCEKNSPVSREESVVDENGNLSNGTELASLHDGDILVTKSSHTLGWRNGHCALVVDAARGKTLESVVLGMNSSVQDIGKWTNYPNFILLRVKDVSGDKLAAIVRTAAEQLNDIPYDLTVGILSPKNAAPENQYALRNGRTQPGRAQAGQTPGKISGTHCSHLVWQAFRSFGIDIDSNGGILVTPKDIVRSPLLEVVQVFGVDPGNIWP